MIICQCDGTVAGIFTAVFEAWSIDINNTSIAAGEMVNREWFAEYRMVETDLAKAERVASAIRKKISRRAYEMVYTACLTKDEDRGRAVLGFLRKGFRIGEAVADDLHDESVMKVYKLSRRCLREYEHYREFLRFRRQDRFLLAKVDPECDILPMLADFFQGRLMQEHFMIVDVNRNIAALHTAGQEYVITEVDAEQINDLAYDEKEEQIRLLWEVFEKTIAIEARINEKLQKQNMPIRYRKYMDIRR